VPIYLDYNATAPIADPVIEAMARAMRDLPGNASSVHAFGQRAKAAIDEARSSLAALLQADSGEIVFTSGGTEAINLSLRGAFDAAGPAGRRRIVTTGIEHEAVLNTARTLADQSADIAILPVPSSGVIDPSTVKGALTRDTLLASVMLANNEIGTVQPVADIAEACRSNGSLIHTDAVQAVGKMPVSVRDLNVDLLSLSAHKFGGPKGVGALWIRRGTRLRAQATGGRQERNRRAGTENVAGIVGLGVAAQLAADRLGHRVHIAALRDKLETAILANVPDTSVNGSRVDRVANTSNISFGGIEAESLLIALDLEGVAVSTGSACSSGTLEPSHVLRAMGLPSSRARNSLRFSLGAATTEREIDFVIETVPRLVSKLRRLGRPAEAVR